MKTLALIASLALAPSTRAQVPSEHYARFFDALKAVEGANGRPTDGGRARGPFCIHRGYWKDATRDRLALRQAGWESCRGRKYSEAIIAAYLTRFCPEAWKSGDWLTCAATHHAGPMGLKRGGRDYAQRVLNLINDHAKDKPN